MNADVVIVARFCNVVWFPAEEGACIPALMCDVLFKAFVFCSLGNVPTNAGKKLSALVSCKLKVELPTKTNRGLHQQCCYVRRRKIFRMRWNFN